MKKLKLRLPCLLVVPMVIAIGLQQCRVGQEQRQLLTPQQVCMRWADLTLYLTKNTPANSPTYASRALGYIGLTMYESVVHGFPEYNSVAPHLNGLSPLPRPPLDQALDWVIALNAGQATILRSIYNQTSDENKLKIDSLEEYVLKNHSTFQVSDPVVRTSAEFGTQVAQTIFEWSKKDGGHRGYLFNFDKAFRHARQPGSWEPSLYGQAISHLPLHPYWGKNRTFVPANSVLPDPEMIPYSTSKTSEYYRQFMMVYEKSQSLTQEEKETALWWGDDPGETFTPPGHSYFLVSTVLRETQADLITCAEAYARVGLGVADAFIKCWKWKYHFFSERPSSYITKNIDPAWQSFWPDPPFPAFPSGHAIQAAATAVILEDLFGDSLSIEDVAHVGRERDELRNVDFKKRTFSSFWQVATETADSRFFGGIHTPQDNDAGLAEGRKIGENVNQLPWRKNAVFSADRKP